MIGAGVWDVLKMIAMMTRDAANDPDYPRYCTTCPEFHIDSLCSILANANHSLTVDDDGLPSLEEAISSVDALVADDPEPSLSQRATAAITVPTRPTPSVPPGLNSRLPPGLAPPLAAASPAISNSKPAAPPTPPPQLPQTKIDQKPPTAKADIATVPSRNISSKPANGKGILDEEEFPALHASKKTFNKPTQTTSAKFPRKSSPPQQDRNQQEKLVEQAQKSILTKTEKGVSPGVLAITGVTKPLSPKILDLSVPGPAERGLDSLTVPSSALRSAPKTLKIVTAPKAEVPPSLPSTSSVPPIPVARNLVFTAGQRPETPASEMVSDSASVSGTVSTSRPGSPSLSKVGSAPVRTTTKSKVRKQRKEAQKEIVEAIAATSKEPEEIAPIVGRKKKQKKVKPPKKPTEVPASIPNDCIEQLGTGESEAGTSDQKSASESLNKHKPPKKVDNILTNLKVSLPICKETGERDEVAAPPKDFNFEKPIVETKQESQLQPPRQPQQATPASIFRDLVSASLIVEESVSMLRPVLATNWRHESLNCSDYTSIRMSYPKSIVTGEDQIKLQSGKPIRKMMDGVRVLLTPNGDCVRNLTEEEEDRYLALQKSVAEANSTPAAFIAPRHTPSAGFTLIKGRAVPNGPPSYFPQAPGAFPSDPAHKVQRDEAIRYINQYVLPRLGLGASPSSGSPSSLKDAMRDASAADSIQRDAADLQRFLMATNSAGSVSGAPTGDDGTLAHYHHYHDTAVNHPRSSSNDSSSGAESSSTNKTNNSGGLSGSVAPLMSLEDAEAAMMLARKETERLEKNLNQAIRRNRRLLLGSAH